MKEITLNDINWYSIITAATEANGMEFPTPKDREIWEQKRRAELYEEAKTKYRVGIKTRPDNQE